MSDMLNTTNVENVENVLNITNTINVTNVNTKKQTKITKHNLGQYFTINIELKEKVFEFILNNPINILEQSIGQSDLVSFVINKNSN